MAIALDNLRVGRVYQMTNQGEVRKLQIIDRLEADNFKVKDLDTLEFYTIFELLQWGKGKDYDLDEIR
ncbi:hypothetical protein JYB64_06875 [Algoriphagus aestuarii]|nr:hypothetical protein [Algoriphagus aestuarii]